jgi:hypothetical protein
MNITLLRQRHDIARWRLLSGNWPYSVGCRLGLICSRYQQRITSAQSVENLRYHLTQRLG